MEIGAKTKPLADLVVTMPKGFEGGVGELEAIASLADQFDHAGRFEKRGIIDEIAARCDGLR